MKKLFLFIAVVFVAMTTWSQKIAIGVKGGMNFSDVSLSNVSSKSKTGWHGGAFCLFRFSRIGIQPEVIFSQQGAEVDLEDWESSYINFPIIFKLYAAGGLNFQIGPQFGFLNKAELAGNDIQENLKSSDISLGFGLGWEAPFGFTLDARYNKGLSDNNDDLNYETVKNQVFQISLGFKLIKL